VERLTGGGFLSQRLRLPNNEATFGRGFGEGGGGGGGVGGTVGGDERCRLIHIISSGGLKAEKGHTFRVLSSHREWKGSGKGLHTVLFT